MQSLKQPILNLQCILDVIVTRVGEVNNVINKKSDNNDIEDKHLIDNLLLQLNSYRYKALIDTGAQSTCITKSMADSIGLISKGKSKMTSATEQTSSVNKYYIDLFIPLSIRQPTVKSGQPGFIENINLKGYPNLPVQEITIKPLNFDVLLGMDILSQCTLILTHGEYILNY